MNLSECDYIIPLKPNSLNEVNDSYKGITFILPEICSDGDIICIKGLKNTFKVTQRKSQIIIFGSVSSTLGENGFIESTRIGDMVCIVCKENCKIFEIPLGSIFSIGNIILA